MAASISGRTLLSFGLLRQCTYCCSHLVIRNLLSSSDTKIEGFLRQRIFITDLLGSERKAALLQKLGDVATPKDAKHAAYSITDLIHVAESETELAELERLFRLISGHDIEELVTFNFGASLIRLYHFLGLPDRAYSMFKDPICRNFLADNTCHKILMDLLYNHRQYECVLDVYSNLQSFNIDCVTLALAAHYQINSTKSFQASQTLVKELLQNHSLSRRALLYTGMLALNQNQPNAALESLNTCRQGDLVINLRLTCKSRLGNLDEVLDGLQEAKVKAEDISKPFNFRLYKDTLDEIRTAVKANASSSQEKKFDQLEKDLAFRGVLSPQRSSVLLDKTIFGQGSYIKEKGKLKVKRAL